MRSTVVNRTHNRLPLLAIKTAFNRPQDTLAPTNSRYASHSSHSWLERQKKDVFRKMSRYDDYRARSAYKLIQIDDKYKFLKPGKIVVEAGAAPGSWTQVICERLDLVEKCKPNAKKGLCIAVDLGSMNPVEGAICLNNTDFTSSFTHAKILSWLDDRKVDCILSDMAPAASGLKDLDHTRLIQILRRLLPFSVQVLRPGSGVLLTKIWNGNQTKELVTELEYHFESVKMVKPEASRKDSAETYLLCQHFKHKERDGDINTNIKPDLF